MKRNKDIELEIQFRRALIFQIRLQGPFIGCIELQNGMISIFLS